MKGVKTEISLMPHPKQASMSLLIMRAEAAMRACLKFSFEILLTFYLIPTEAEKTVDPVVIGA